MIKDNWPEEKEWPKQNEEYIFLDETVLEGVDEKETTSIKIIKGEFTDVIYRYGIIEVVDTEKPPKIKFDYYILNTGNFDIEDLRNNKKFVTVMGDILVSIFDDNILKKENIKDESIGTNDIEEPDL
jgi:hypothetical protein